MRLQHIASAWYSLESVLLGTHLLFRESQQKQIDDHLVWFAATMVESKLSIDSEGVSLYAFPFAIKHNEMSLFGKSFVFETYKYEWSIEDNESCNRKRLQIYLRNENEIPVFREFPFSGTTKKPFSPYLSGIHLLLSDIRRSINYALIWHPELKLVRGFKSIWVLAQTKGWRSKRQAELFYLLTVEIWPSIINSFDAKF